tara:strand:+ start:262 stop:438 length:177 start_codon:yes stop_codon:yes gene_type:complete
MNNELVYLLISCTSTEEKDNVVDWIQELEEEGKIGEIGSISFKSKEDLTTVSNKIIGR